MLLTPPAIHKEPFQATVLTAPPPPSSGPPNIVFPFADAFQVIPSREYASVSTPAPPATWSELPDATERANPVKIAFAAVHVTPFGEYARTFVPSPPAIHLLPVHATLFAVVEKIVFPFADATQLIPSAE
jgi:hypothetical protein